MNWKAGKPTEQIIMGTKKEKRNPLSYFFATNYPFPVMISIKNFIFFYTSFDLFSSLSRVVNLSQSLCSIENNAMEDNK